MWVFLSDSFLSIVEDRANPARLLVRGRIKGDIERAFPEASVTETPDADYRYRARIDRDAVAEALARQVYQMNYDNFKGSVKDIERHNAYFDCWRAMVNYQTQAHLVSLNNRGQLVRDCRVSAPRTTRSKTTTT